MPASSPEDQRKPCPACHAIREPGDCFCEACGVDLQAVHPVPATDPRVRCVACTAGVIGPEGYCDWCGLLQPRPRDRVEIDLGVAAGVSDRGRRHRRNEDALALRRAGSCAESACAVVAVVCDGVSSAACSDDASQAAADAAADALLASLDAGAAPEPATRDAIAAALEAVVDLARPKGGCIAPACTYVSAVVTSTSITVGWVGDSRAYWVALHDGHEPSSRLTVDDSWAAEMVASGALSEAQAAADRRAHAITAWLGPDAEEVSPHVRTVTPGGDGLVIVCSDGLWNYLGTGEEIAAALPADAVKAPLDAAAELVRVACEAGGHDNITVAVLPFVSAPPAGDRSAQR